jgi:hypothetical protein
MNNFGYVSDADENTSITLETRTCENASIQRESRPRWQSRPMASSAAEQLTPRELHQQKEHDQHHCRIGH